MKSYSHGVKRCPTCHRLFDSLGYASHRAAHFRYPKTKEAK